MKTDKAISILRDAAENYLGPAKSHVEIDFSEKELFGHGKIESKDGKAHILIGMPHRSKSFFQQNKRMSNTEFTKVAVTLFHELGHYSRSVSKDTPKEICMSELSKYGNEKYYIHNWHMLLHEIDAEYIGITSAWSMLKNVYPDKADKLMLDHLTDRAQNTVYMIHMPEEGFTSKTQINSLFEQAYDNASRTLPLGFLRSDDEVARMCTTDDKILRLEYAAIYNKLATPASGKEMDKMMASIVSYIHPELQETYPTIDFDELNPSHIFKIQIPETTNEIRSRLGLNSSFAEAVRRLSSDDSQLTL